MENPVHVRRCHVCGTVSEHEEDVLKCDSCGKSLLPFFFFDKRKIPVDPADFIREEDFRREYEKRTYGPIKGLTAFW